jgi:sensor histidine kinase regulating citrate/malate metabolism
VGPEPETRPDLTDEELLGAFNDHQMILALLECATQAIIAIDARGRIALANRRAVEMFGYTRRDSSEALWRSCCRNPSVSTTRIGSVNFSRISNASCPSLAVKTA